MKPDESPLYEAPGKLTYPASPLAEKAPVRRPTPPALLDNSPPFSRENTTYSLCWAAEQDHTEVIKELIHHEADVNADLNGTTPLIQSAMSGTESVTEILLCVGNINVNWQNPAGQSALWCASNLGHSAIVMLLLQREDVRIEDKNEHGFTPLATAAVEGHTEVVELLLAKGANTGTRDSAWNLTPMSWARRLGNVDTANVLRAEELRGRSEGISFQSVRGHVLIWWSNCVELMLCEQTILSYIVDDHEV